MREECRPDSKLEGKTESYHANYDHNAHFQCIEQYYAPQENADENLRAHEGSLLAKVWNWDSCEDGHQKVEAVHELDRSNYGKVELATALHIDEDHGLEHKDGGNTRHLMQKRDEQAVPWGKPILLRAQRGAKFHILFIFRNLIPQVVG